MASIKKLANGSYQATVFIGRDSKGKQLRKYITKPTMKECKAAARELEQEIEEKRFINVDNVRMAAWMEKWLELNKESLAPSTFLGYKMYVEVHFNPYFGQLKLSQINEIHIKEYMNAKLKELSSTTVRKHMLILRRILEDALKHKSPCKDIKIPNKDDYKPTVLSEDDFKAIHDSVKDDPVMGLRDEGVILLAAWCGLRRGEIFALKWDDIDWKKFTLRIDESRSISEEGYIDKKPKSKNGLRTIVVPEYLIRVLELYRKSLKKITERIFPIRPDHFSSYFAKMVKTRNLPSIRFHDLRHYHASWLYKQGIPDHYAAQRLGHDIHVLKGIYQHLDMDVKSDIDNLIRSNFDEKKDKPFAQTVEK
ncbi:integrase [Anaerosolibacter carboniphilus]|uniref:Integrase n=1 Tax=Anaerosolibacter carboniphilus TaxID=1417629 RepID=A0A841KQD8_9FIRM|nr:site-specific integrase [Anaerosolibacter carboniphilus]MBB6215633.1 integrase [Anaerosolibacter carboniphilus]